MEDMQSAASDLSEPLETNPPDINSGVDSASAAASAEEAAQPLLSAVDASLKAVLQAIIYVTDEPLTAQQMAAGLNVPLEEVEKALAWLVADHERPEVGLSIREVAGGYKMGTKAEHHEAVRSFVKSLKVPLKLSLAALETLAVIAYKQPITAPEIMEIRGVQGAGVLKTLIERKLITTSGRKAVIGKPILYKTTKDFLLQFGLKDLAELPTLKEFEELRRLALSDEPGDEALPVEPAPVADSPAEPAEAESQDAVALEPPAEAVAGEPAVQAAS
jgi:segregation and condensation protein B